jgi:crotonobetainyl-CoA:carnitine CoA-transferase CaiB-like acyl-CoA transferase
MSKQNKLSQRQLDVIEDLFAGELDEQAVLEKHRVNPRLYKKWQADDAFIAQFERRIAAAHRQSAAMIARYAPVAAAKLVQLTQCDKEETARKACLDIISMQTPLPAPLRPKAADPDAPEQSPMLSGQTASKILAFLAEQADAG